MAKKDRMKVWMGIHDNSGTPGADGSLEMSVSFERNGVIQTWRKKIEKNPGLGAPGWDEVRFEVREELAEAFEEAAQWMRATAWRPLTGFRQGPNGRVPAVEKV